jgi:hypothetical protein
MTALASNSRDATRYDPCTSYTFYLAVVENTVAVLLPSLPVAGYAAAILKGMDESIHVLNVGVEPVASEACFAPASHKGGAVLISRRYFK